MYTLTICLAFPITSVTIIITRIFMKFQHDCNTTVCLLLLPVLLLSSCLVLSLFLLLLSEFIIVYQNELLTSLNGDCKNNNLYDLHQVHHLHVLCFWFIMSISCR